MSKGWYYPNSQIENHTKLIIEGIKYKRKFEFELRKISVLDSLNSSLVESNFKLNTKIRELYIDSIQSRKHILMINDFQKTTVIPFYEKELKKSKKNGVFLGSLSTISLIFGLLYFSR